MDSSLYFDLPIWVRVTLQGVAVIAVLFPLAAACSMAERKISAWIQGRPGPNRTIPPLRYDLVHQLKRDRPLLTIELNGGLQTPAACLEQLQQIDGVMVGRAVYEHPLRWASVDQLVHGRTDHQAATASTVLRGLMPHAERWIASGGRLWAIARHLVHLVEAVPGARHWRGQLSRQAAERSAGADVLAAAALQLEERGL